MDQKDLLKVLGNSLGIEVDKECTEFTSEMVLSISNSNEQECLSVRNYCKGSSTLGLKFLLFVSVICWLLSNDLVFEQTTL